MPLHCNQFFGTCHSLKENQPIIAVMIMFILCGMLFSSEEVYKNILISIDPSLNLSDLCPSSNYSQFSSETNLNHSTAEIAYSLSRLGSSERNSMKIENCTIILWQDLHFASRIKYDGHLLSENMYLVTISWDGFAQWLHTSTSLSPKWSGAYYSVFWFLNS